MATVATFLMSLLSFLNKYSGTIMAVFAFWAGKSAGIKEVAAEQAKEDAALEKDYLDNRTKPRTDGDVIGRVQDGSF